MKPNPAPDPRPRIGGIIGQLLEETRDHRILELAGAVQDFGKYVEILEKRVKEIDQYVDMCPGCARDLEADRYCWHPDGCGKTE